MGKVKLRKVTKKGRKLKCPVSGQGKERVWFLTPALLLTPWVPFSSGSFFTHGQWAGPGSMLSSNLELE